MIQTYLNDFDVFEKKYPGPVAHSVQFDFQKHPKHIVFCAIIHGDEVGAIPAFLEMIQALATGHLSFGGKVTFFLGNVPAALQNKRFLEKDLNRSFNPPNQSYRDLSVDSAFSAEPAEYERAANLMPLLQECDLLFDFHQTAQPTKYPFYAFGFDYKSYLWARIAGCTQMFVTRPSKQSFSAGGMCIDEYVRSFGKPAVTLELSQRGFTPAAKNISKIVIRRVLKSVDQICFGIAPSLEKLARKNGDLKFLFTVHKEPFSHPQKKLVNGLTNFSSVEKGQILGTDEQSKPILAPCTGLILFPKYPVRDEHGNSLEVQSELFLLCQRVN